LETDSLTVELTPLFSNCRIADFRLEIGRIATNLKSLIWNLQSLHFFMRRMLAAPAAELAQFQPVGLRLTVLGRRIIPLFAITALHRNDLSGHRKTAPSF
jgi:hypothetical protein